MLSPTLRLSLLENLIFIDNKDRETVPFQLNRVQKHFCLNKGHRNIILKARQLGMSSVILADNFIEAVTVPNTTIVVVSHESHATEKLLDRVHFYYKLMPNPKPELGHKSSYELSFPSLNSNIYIGTAKSMTFGRGDRIDRCHLSELAFYDDGERIVNAIEEAVPLKGEITVECSPNGEDNYFYQMWVKAREKKSGYKPFFFPWWLDSTYAIEKGSPFALEEDRFDLVLDDEEKDLRRKYNITDDQLRWRRRKMADKGGLFYQEYPEDEVTCFLTSGEPVFDMYLLNKLGRECYEGRHDDRGWEVWIEPQMGMRYTVGADTSEGSVSYSAACVLDENNQVCATYTGKVEPAVFAGLLDELGKFYNLAELAIERNQTGYGVLAYLAEKNYPRLYKHRDFTTGRETGKIGWWTNEQTKSFLFSNFKNMLPELKTWDSNLIRQAKGYRYVKMKATAQTFDDLLIATMIALAVKNVYGSGTGFVGTVQGWDW